jgi:septal ring factor EnvC (AmiA/AmiB activator)
MLTALALALAVPSGEVRIAAAEARLAELDRRRAGRQAAIAAAQAPLARLLAAIERLALRPPLLALARPGAIDDMIHAQALLGALRPAIAARTAALRGDMVRTRALRAEAARTLAAIEAERSLYQNALGARLMTLPAPPSPSVTRAAGFYRLPAPGIVLTGSGERGDGGNRARGLTLLTAPEAEVIAPAPGRVAYAGAYGGYGGIVILDHGGGWTTLLTGLDHADARVGTQVARGALLGGMGGRARRLTIELRRSGVPVDVAMMLAQ